MISIVDDDESIRQATKTLLRSVGFQVGIFDSAELFLGSGALAQTDCLILDVRIPGMDGLKLQRRLRDRNSSVPIIFITAHEDRQRRSQALSAGAVDFLSKPFEPSTLVAAVRAALASRGEPVAVPERPSEWVAVPSGLLVVITAEPDDQTCLNEILPGPEWNVAFFGSCQEAWASVERASVVICDEQLPDGSWTDLLEKVLAISHPPIFMVASHSASDDKLWAILLWRGGDEVLAKPFRAEEVRQSVVSGLRRRNKLRASAAP